MRKWQWDKNCPHVNHTGAINTFRHPRIFLLRRAAGWFSSYLQSVPLTPLTCYYRLTPIASRPPTHGFASFAHQMLSRLLEVLCASNYAVAGNAATSAGDGYQLKSTAAWEEEVGTVVLGSYLDGLQQTIETQPGTQAAMLATFKLAEGFVRNAVRSPIHEGRNGVI
jgi:hypothetical protein